MYIIYYTEYVYNNNMHIIIIYDYLWITLCLFLEQASY